MSERLLYTGPVLRYTIDCIHQHREGEWGRNIFHCCGFFRWLDYWQAFWVTICIIRVDRHLALDWVTGRKISRIEGVNNGYLYVRGEGGSQYAYLMDEDYAYEEKYEWTMVTPRMIEDQSRQVDASGRVFRCW